MFTELAAKENCGGVRSTAAIKYIVLHYTGNDGDTARNNLQFFKNLVVKSSAHYFVDDSEVCCSVSPGRVAWHCGTVGKYKHKVCRNSNSIGVEMCSRRDGNGKFYITEMTQKRAAAFVAQLMKTYNVPIENVLRHFDVTGKLCPRPMVDEKAWDDFKKLILSEKDGETLVKYYENLADIPKGEFRDTISDLIGRGVIKGSGEGLHLSEDMIRTLVFIKRMLKA